MTAQHQQNPFLSRKVIGILLVVLLLALGLSGGWYWVAGKLGATINAVKQSLHDDGKQLSCTGQEIRGFPFRIGVFCDDFFYADPLNAVTVKGGELRSAAQIYNPAHLVTEIDAPLALEIPGLAPLQLDWRDLRSSSRLSPGGIERLSLVTKGLEVSANDGGRLAPLGKIGELALHARIAPEGEAGRSSTNADIALAAEEWRVASGDGATIEAIDIRLDATINDALQALDRGDLLRHLREQGGSGDLKGFSIETASGGRLALAGPFEIDRQGRLSARITLDLENPETLIAYAGKVFPPAVDFLADTRDYLAAFADQSGGELRLEDFHLSIEKGRVKAGIFTIGEVPPLF